MILIGFSWQSTAVTILMVTLVILLLIIMYRWLLRYLSKGTPDKEDYCVLYNLEKDPAEGELEFYFTTEEKKQYSLQILDSDMNQLEEIASQESFVGGNIIRYDSSKLKNGQYFYCLKTDNQKTMKMMQVLNG